MLISAMWAAERNHELVGTDFRNRNEFPLSQQFSLLPKCRAGRHVDLRGLHAIAYKPPTLGRTPRRLESIRVQPRVA